MNLLDFSNQKQRNKIYLCGFLANRIHNEQIYSIARELMLSFFVCTNPTSVNKWSKKETSDLLTQCDVMVFWLNRYTLNDRNCLTALQIGLQQNIPVVMVRHPRMRLVVNPILMQDRVKSEGPELTTANMTYLQYAILEGYKQSTEYDRSSHELSLQRLVNKIMEAKYANSRSVSPPTSGSTDTQEASDFLKLPPVPVPSSYSFGSMDQRRLSSISHILARSRSYDSMSMNVANVGIPLPLHNGMKKPPNGKLPPTNRRNGSLPRTITLKKSKTVIDGELSNQGMFSLNVPKNSFLSSSPDLRNDTRESALRNTNDPELYHPTQYMVFPLADKSHKPKLVHFPYDIVNKGQDVEVESLWGSTDSSLADEVDRASVLQGDLFVSSPPATPAPYIEPL